MDATTTRQTIRRLDATYRAAGLLAVVPTGQEWTVRVGGKCLVRLVRPIEWASDAAEAGMDILAN